MSPSDPGPSDPGPSDPGPSDPGPGAPSGRREASVSLVAGVVLALLIFAPFTGSKTGAIVIAWWLQLLAALAAMVVYIRAVAPRVTARILRDGRQFVRSLGFGLATFLVGVLAGLVTNLVYALLSPGAGFCSSFASCFKAYIFAPAFWLLLFGTLPALALGWLFGETVERRYGRRPAGPSSDLAPVRSSHARN
jgi:hypothetical protein